MKTIYIREETDGVIKEYDINLTKMFGEGKEPSLREYINMFPPISYNTKPPKVEYDGNMDKECIALCDALNNLPKTKTFESCCGHLINRFSIWFFCISIDTLSRLARSTSCNYSDGKWEIVADSTDTSPRGVFWLRSTEVFKNTKEMEESVNNLIRNIEYWFKKDFDEYFSKNK